VTGPRLAEVGNLSPHPDIAQDLVGLEQLAQVIGERGDGENHGLKWGKVEFKHE